MDRTSSSGCRIPGADIGACLALLALLGTFNQTLQINIDNYDWRVEY